MFASWKFEGYVWFSKNLRENTRKRKYKEKVKENKKNRLKVDKFIFFVTSNSFYIF